jgi:hypothetical protein
VKSFFFISFDAPSATRFGFGAIRRHSRELCSAQPGLELIRVKSVHNLHKQTGHFHERRERIFVHFKVS